MGKKKMDAAVPAGETRIEENSLFAKVSEIIESRKSRAGAYANREITMMFWEIGRHIGSVLLNNKRAKYGERIVVTLSQQLVEKYGKTFDVQNLRRMMRFAEKIQ